MSDTVQIKSRNPDPPEEGDVIQVYAPNAEVGDEASIDHVEYDWMATGTVVNSLDDDPRYAGEIYRDPRGSDVPEDKQANQGYVEIEINEVV